MRALVLTFTAAAALALAACSAPESAQTPPAEAPAADAPATAPADPNVLTPEGFGPLRIGMTVSEVEAALGPDSDPNAVGGPEPETCDQWRPARAPEGLLVMIQDGVLTRVSVSEPATIGTTRVLESATRPPPSRRLTVTKRWFSRTSIPRRRLRTSPSGPRAAGRMRTPMSRTPPRAVCVTRSAMMAPRGSFTSAALRSSWSRAASDRLTA